MEPEAVVEHKPEETLLGPALAVAVTTDAAAVLTAHIAGQRERHLVERRIGPVEILDLHAVVSVDAPARGYEQIISAQAVIVGNDVDPRLRCPFDLTAQARPVIGGCIGLPSLMNQGSIFKWAV